MSHSWESDFRRKLASSLIEDGWGIRSNVYLDCNRFVDLVAVHDEVVIAIETESRFSHALKGVSQAAIYAEGIGEQYPDRPVYPLVALPEGHVDEPERTWIENQTGVPIEEYDF